MAHVALPMDIIRLVCEQILLDATPTRPSLLLDPHIRISPAKGSRTSEMPTTAPSPSAQAQMTLKALCLVSKNWNSEARKALWASGIQFGLPKSFESVLQVLEPIQPFFSRPAGWRSCRRGDELNLSAMEPDLFLEDLDESSESDVTSELSLGSIMAPVEVLSNSGSDLRDTPSPNSGSVERQALLSTSSQTAFLAKSLERTADSILSREWGMNSDKSYRHIADKQLDEIFNISLCITSLSFSKFRSHGMRRSVAEGNQTRYVTSERLLRLLKSTRTRRTLEFLQEGQDACLRAGRLEAIGFSEYMDSAISKRVLEEILLRGGAEVEYAVDAPGKLNGVGPTPKAETNTAEWKIVNQAGHSHIVPLPVDGYMPIPLPTLRIPIPHGTKNEWWKASSLTNETPVRALDLCGCISFKFRDSLNDFINDHALATPFMPFATRRDPRNHSFIHPGNLQATRFNFLTRLGLNHVMILSDLELGTFLSGFVNLRDLDLGHTRAGPIVLHTLQLIKQADKANGSEVKPSLRSLSLAKCRGLTQGSLLGFFCGNLPGEDVDESNRWEDPKSSIGRLEELSLYGDSSLPTPLDQMALQRIFSTSPCFLSGRLTTLDLSSIEIDDSSFVLAEVMPPQPNLLQFGLAFCRRIKLASIRQLLENKMASVEVLDISSSCQSARHRTNQLAYRSLPAIPTALLHNDLIDRLCAVDAKGERLSNLRVIELEDASLQAIGGGARGWKVAFGKGQRGWYVDLSVTVKVSSGLQAFNSSSSQSRTLPFARKVIPRHQTRVEQPCENVHESSLEECLTKLKDKDEVIRHADIGWMSRKIEILHGGGMLARQSGLHGFYAFETR